MSKTTAPRLSSLPQENHISLCETLDRALNKGVVVSGEAVISLANVDLIYVGLQLILTSVETVRAAQPGAASCPRQEESAA